MSADYHLELQDITKDFGGLRAINNLSFQIGRQEILGLIGPNGSGKSTSVNIISGVYKPSSGQILFKGEPVHSLPPWKIAKLGIQRTFQITQAFPLQSVLENVLFGCHLHENSGVWHSVFRRNFVGRERRQSEARAMEILERVGLHHHAMRPVATLPPGPQRILAIAMALAAKPEVLLLDEPACGLSADESNQLIELTRKLRDEGLTVMVIDHHMRVIMSLCDRIVVIDHGTKIADGSPQEIAANEQVIEAYLGHRKVD